MKSARIAKRMLLISLLIGVSSFSSLFPSAAFAAEVGVKTAQVLPLGQSSSCQQLSVTSFTPYIYENSLNSFDFTIADPSYVALIATVGDTAIPFNQMTRRVDAGVLRIHVDIESTPIYGTLPITVTLLSAKSGVQTVCLSVVTTNVVSAVQVPTSAPTKPTSSSSSSSGSTVSKPTVTKPVVAKPSTSTKATSTATTTSVFGTTTKSVSALSAMLSSLSTACTTVAGASRLWFVLLALYALIAGITATGQFQSKSPRAKEWAAAFIVVPFLILFGIWFLMVSCRTGIWAPIISILIALAGLAGVYWNERGTTAVIALPQGQKPKPPALPQTQTQSQQGKK